MWLKIQSLVKQLSEQRMIISELLLKGLLPDEVRRVVYNAFEEGSALGLLILPDGSQAFYVMS
jgi:hypothetical protein